MEMSAKPREKGEKVQAKEKETDKIWVRNLNTIFDVKLSKI